MQLVVIGFMIALVGISGCGEVVHDYSGLEPGDVPRPDFEYVFDFEYWFGLINADELIPPEARGVMDAIGFTSLERTNLIAYERGEQVVVECSYRLKGEQPALIQPFLAVQPPEGKLLGRLDNTDVVMSFYFSGLDGFLDAIGSVITDPMALEYIFQGDKNAARMAKLSFRTAKSQVKGMFLDLFEDEFLVVFFENPDFTGEMMEIPFRIACVAPTAHGKPVVPELIDLIQTFSSLAWMFGGDRELGALLEPKETELSGYECCYWDLGHGFEIGMIDADGYFVISDFDGLEKTLSALDRSQIPYEDIEPANMYFYMNYDLYFNNVLGPMIEAFEETGGWEELSEEMPPEVAVSFKESMAMSREMLDAIMEIESPGWADVAFRFTGNGFEMKEQVSKEMAEFGLSMKDEATEMLKKMFADFPEGFGIPGLEEAPPPEREPLPEDVPPGAVF
jgi:hypothetical protein